MAITSTITLSSATTYYAVLTPQTGANAGKVWNGTGYESWTDGNVANYGVDLARRGTSLEYILTLPGGADQVAVHDVQVYAQVGGSPNPLASGDALAGSGTIGGGIADAAVSGIATSATTAATQSTTAATNTGTLLARVTSGLFTGITSLANWLSAGFRKDSPDPTAAGEINAVRNSISGTYAAATDSLQAIVDEVPSQLTVLPIASSIANGQISSGNLVAFQFAAFGPFDFCLRDQRGNPISVTGDSITFVVSDDSNTWLWEITGCTVSGDANNIVTVGADSTNTQASGNFRYNLRDITTGRVLGYGYLQIVPLANAV